MRKNNKKILTLLMITVALISITSAAATSLPIAPNTITNTQSTPCTTTTLAAGVTTDNNNNNYLTINNIPTTCYNSTLAVKIITNGSNTPQTINGTLGTTNTYTSTTPVTNPSQVTDVKTFINSWYIPTSWTYTTPSTDPISPSSSTPGTTVTTTWSQPSTSQFCATIVVSTTSTTPIVWKADLNINGAPFNNDTNVNDYQINPSYKYGFVSNTPTNGAFTLQGTQPTSNTVSNTISQTIQICNYNTPPAAVNPNLTYTETETTPTPSYYVCKTVTVTVTGSPTFLVGWSVNVDTTNLQNNYIPGGGSIKGPYGGYSHTQIGTSNIYTITGTGYNTQGIKDGTPAVFQICWG